MEIKLIGTGGIFSPYNSACTIIDRHILIDLPNGTLKQLRKNNYHIVDIDYVFITHFHADHYFDFPFLLLEKTKSKNHDLTIIAPNNAPDIIKHLTELAFPESADKIFKTLKIKYIQNDSKTKIKDITIESIKMHHGLTEDYGYIFNSRNFVIGFTGDTSICPGVHEMALKCDKVVIDSTFEVGDDNHLGINNILELLKEYPETIFIPTHMSPKEKRILEFQSFDNLLILNDFDDIFDK